MYWVDKTIQHFFEEASRQGLMDDRTLFIVTSDHNPHSGGEYKTLVTNPQDKQSVAPIPVIFISKNLAPLADLDESMYASQQDMAPTLLTLLGQPVPQEFLDGTCSSRYLIPMPWDTSGARPTIIPRTGISWPPWMKRPRIRKKKMPWPITSCTAM